MINDNNCIDLNYVFECLASTLGSSEFYFKKSRAKKRIDLDSLIAACKNLALICAHMLANVS